MIRNCPNCASKLVYDINLEALSCDSCGGIFDVEEYDEKYGIEEPEDEAIAEQFREDDLDRQAHKLMIDVNVYTCQTCGADVMISNTELSTVCVYCGNSSIVFSRIKKINRPDAIIPFAVNKNVAETLVENKIKESLFVPKDFKTIDKDKFIGVYIPYYVHAVKFRDTFTVEYYEEERKAGQKHSNKVRRTMLFSGEAVLDRLTTDACINLNDELSFRVEPFDLTKVEAFSDDYLYGFYADIPDQDKDVAFQVASKRAKDVVYSYAIGKTPLMAEDCRIINSLPEIEEIKEPLLIMCPMWFYVSEFNGEKHTTVVNGQTGKVVTSIPVDKCSKNISIVALAVLTLLVYFLVVFLLTRLGISEYKILAYLFAIGETLMIYVIKELISYRSSSVLAKSATTARFASRRQGVK